MRMPHLQKWESSFKEMIYYHLKNELANLSYLSK